MQTTMLIIWFLGLQAFQQVKALLNRSSDRVIEHQHKIACAKSIGVSTSVLKRNHAHSTIWSKLSLLFVGSYRVTVKHNKAHCKSVADGSVQWLHFDVLKMAD